MSGSPIEAVAFDVNETLFALDRLRPAFSDAGLDPRLVPVWFAGLLRDGFALAALGGYRPFAEVAAETLRGLDSTVVDDDVVAAVTAAMRELDPHPDVQPALRALHDAGTPAAGLHAAWVNRSGRHWPAIFPEPESSAPNLTALGDALLATRHR